MTMPTSNHWGVRPDPVTGLPPYAARSKATVARLNRQAAEAKERRQRVEENLAGITALFATAFAEADRAAQTQARIAAAAKSVRKY